MPGFEQAYQYWMTKGGYDTFAGNWYDCRKKRENPGYFSHHRDAADVARYKRQIDEASEKIVKILYDFGSDYYFGNKRGFEVNYGQLLELEAPELEELCDLTSKFNGVLSKFDFSKAPDDKLILCSNFAAITKYGHRLELTGRKISMTACYNRIVNLVRKIPAGSGKAYFINEFFCKNKGAPAFFAMRLKVLEKLADEVSDLKLQYALMSDFDHCEHMADEAFYDNFIEKVIPRAVENPKNTFGLAADKWSSRAGGIGLADFAYQSYARKITPKNIHLLICMSREIPSLNARLHEKNRKDAKSLDAAFEGFKDAFYAAAPGMGILADKMLAYYDAKDDPALLSDKRRDLIETGDVFLPESDGITDLARYDAQNETGKKNIAVLRRLRKNMPGAGCVRPETGDREADALAKELEEHPSLETVGALLEDVNKKLVKMIERGQRGIVPETVELLDWIDMRTAAVLQKIDVKKQTGLYKNPVFKQILLFSDLINNNCDDFDPEAFEKFYNKKIFNAETPETAYRKAAERQVKNMFSLFALYDEIRKTGFFDRESGGTAVCNYADIVKLQSKERKERIVSGTVLKAVQAFSCIEGNDSCGVHEHPQSYAEMESLYMPSGTMDKIAK